MHNTATPYYTHCFLFLKVCSPLHGAKNSSWSQKTAVGAKKQQLQPLSCGLVMFVIPQVSHVSFDSLLEDEGLAIR